MGKMKQMWGQVRALWRVTGPWGMAWAVWVTLAMVVQGTLMWGSPELAEARRHANAVFTIGTFVLMFVVIDRLQKAKEAALATEKQTRNDEADEVEQKLKTENEPAEQSV
ncbi:MAG: hypothetical protein OHK0029_00920 [Armatimonadaceae bacterium]